MLVATGGMERGVFLDRDGVINDAPVRDGKPYSPVSREAMKILPGVPETLERFCAAGLRVIVVTNQPDVGRGILAVEQVEEMHRWLLGALAIDAIKVCFHVDADSCVCRKPKPGLLIQGAREWGLDLGSSYLVGDRWRDIGAGRAVGCRTFWIDRGYREPRAENPDRTVSSLEEAGRIILQEGNE